MSAVVGSGVLDTAPMSVGALLKSRRATLGMSQQQVATKADVGLSAYKQYETDRTFPLLDKAARVADALQLDPRLLFDELLNPGSVSEDDEDLQGYVSAKPGQADKVEDGSVLPEGEDPFGNPEAEPLMQLKNLAEWKGRGSLRMPEALDDVELAISEMDVDELEALAKTMGFEHIECTEKETLLALAGDERDERCQDLIERLILAALYGDAIDTLTGPEMEAVANIIRTTVHNGVGSIQRRFVLDPKSSYEKRLRRELRPYLIEAVRRRRPVDIDVVKGDLAAIASEAENLEEQ